MRPTLPPPLDAYFSAANAHDADGSPPASPPTPSCMTSIEDQAGRDAIRAWADETGRRYRHTAEVRAVETEGDRTTVTAKVSGNFPGSPIELRYGFTLANELVRRLEIG